MSINPVLERTKVLGTPKPDTQITPDVARRLYLRGNHLRPDALIGHEVDLLDYGRAVEQFVAPAQARAGQDQCLRFVEVRNPELGRALREFLGR